MTFEPLVGGFFLAIMAGWLFVAWSAACTYSQHVRLMREREKVKVAVEAGRAVMQLVEAFLKRDGGEMERRCFHPRSSV